MNTQKTKATVAPHHDENFEGYTIDELRYQIVYATLQKEFAKDRLLNKYRKAYAQLPFIGKASAGGEGRSGLVGKILSGLNYTDYILVGASAFRTVKKVFSFFKKKKKCNC